MLSFCEDILRNNNSEKKKQQEQIVFVFVKRSAPQFGVADGQQVLVQKSSWLTHRRTPD